MSGCVCKNVTLKCEAIPNYKSRPAAVKELKEVENEAESSNAGSEDTSSSQPKPWNIYEFASSSSLHGISRIFSEVNSKPRRATWLIAFLASLILFLLQSSNRASLYLSYPHVTKLDEVAVGDLAFPAITICNVNEFRFKKITTQDMKNVGQFLGFLDENNRLKMPSSMNKRAPESAKLAEKMRQLTNFNVFERNARPNTFDMFEFYNRTGHDISQSLLMCKYRGQGCNASWFGVAGFRVTGGLTSEWLSVHTRGYVVKFCL